MKSRIDTLEAHDHSLQEQVLQDSEEIQDLQDRISAKDKLLEQFDHKHKAEIVSLQVDLAAANKTVERWSRRCDSLKMIRRNAKDSKEQMVRTKKKEKRALITQHQEEPDRMREENRELHAILIQSCEGNDPHDDQYWQAKFGTLQGKVLRLVKKHFSTTQGTTRWKEYDQIRAQDDRGLFLQADITTVIAKGFFDHEAHLFGLDERNEGSQAAFERLLLSCNGE